MRNGLANSLAIALPATIIPIGIAAFAAYAFAWIDFQGRQALFIATVSLLAIPLQIALVPLLQLYNFGAHLTIPWLDKTITVFPDLGLDGHDQRGVAQPHRVRPAVRHLPAAQLHLVAAARPVRGGADRRCRPLQDLLAARPAAVGAGARRVRHLPVPVDVERLPRRRRDDRRQPADAFPTTIVDRQPGAASSASSEHLLTAGAFVQAAVPLVVFFLLQRFFVRGILAGRSRADQSVCVTVRARRGLTRLRRACSVDAFAGLGVEEVEVVGGDGDLDPVVGGLHLWSEG